MQNNGLLNETSPKEATKKAEELAAQIRLDDPSLGTTYGTETMRNISHFADTLLEQVKAKNSDQVGENLNSLMGQVREFDPRSMADARPNALERIPLIGGIFNHRERSLAKFKTLSGQVDAISLRLEDTMTGLLRDVEVLEQLYNLNRSLHNELSIYLEAGQIRLEKAKEEELPSLMSEAEQSSGSMASQGVRDFSEQINRFERRLHDLQLSRSIALQTAPQIRLIQSNDQTLAEKIQTSILTTIPIWKSQMVLALSLYAQKGAASLQKNVADTTNAMLRSNAELLEQATVETAQQVERSIVDLNTLKDVHEKLIHTIEETLRISHEGREQRRQAEHELAAMEEDLKSKLTALAHAQRQAAVEEAKSDS